jgi:hypothetical protein
MSRRVIVGHAFLAALITAAVLTTIARSGSDTRNGPGVATKVDFDQTFNDVEAISASRSDTAADREKLRLEGMRRLNSMP